MELFDMSQCSAPVLDQRIRGYRRCLKRADNENPGYDHVPLCSTHEDRANRRSLEVIHNQQAHIEKLKEKIAKFEITYELEKQERVEANRKHYLENMSVYFMRCGKFIKIGASESPMVRLETIRHTGGVASPKGLDLSATELIGTMHGDFKRERELHKKFSHLRDAGEWFRAEPELLTYIRNLEPTANK